MKIRETTPAEKLKHPNMDYVIEYNTSRQYFTRSALIEMKIKLTNFLSMYSL